MGDWLKPPSIESLRAKGRVVTLGMFIIDHFRSAGSPEDGAELQEAIGGGGVYAMTAARLFLPPANCGLIVDRGIDFPERFARELKALGDEMMFYRSRQGNTTRALNSYSGSKIGEGKQMFEYLTERVKLSPKDLVLPPSPFASPCLPRIIHMVCTTQRAKEIIEEIQIIRNGGYEGVGLGWKPELVWEPLGDSCSPEGLRPILDILPHIAVFSPNLLEMQSILSRAASESPEAVVEAARHFEDLAVSHIGRCHTAIIVRAGPLGSFTLSSSWTGWVPAFWGPDRQDQVVDVTGGGNAWLGGLCAGLLLTDGDMRTASIYASAAASFAIQQRGLPRLSLDGGQERWNDDDPWSRLREMAAMVSDPPDSLTRTGFENTAEDEENQ